MPNPDPATTVTDPNVVSDAGDTNATGNADTMPTI
jgi:hypothetical protein